MEQSVLKISNRSKAAIVAVYAPLFAMSMMPVLPLLMRVSGDRFVQYFVASLSIPIGVAIWYCLTESLGRARRKSVVMSWWEDLKTSEHPTAIMRATLEGKYPTAGLDPALLIKDAMLDFWGIRQRKIDETLALLVEKGVSRWQLEDLRSLNDPESVIRLWHNVLILAQSGQYSRTRAALKSMGNDGFKIASNLPPIQDVPASVMLARSAWVN